MNFNQQQLKAINHINGACAVNAGAGSGKSTVLVGRIDNMVNINNIRQEDILAISFTRNTAEDLKHKLYNKGLPNVTVGTFHGICFSILSKEGYPMKKSMEKLKCFEIENLFKKISCSDGKVNVKDILSFISYQKNYMRGCNDTFLPKDSNYTEEELRIFYKEYEKYKKSIGAYDNDDLLIECYKLLSEIPNRHTWQYILVDEHQDSNLIQNKLIKLLCPSGNVFCVFDYRQAIYTFRGGNPEYCMNFDKDYPDATIINLDHNYRSCKNIVDNANSFIKNYYGEYRYYSDSKATNMNKGDINILTHYSKDIEAIEVAYKIEGLLKNGENPNEICVLYRLNSHSIHIENELKDRKIPYYIENDSSFFKRKEIEIIMCCLRLINNPHDNGAYETISASRIDTFKFLAKTVMDDIKAFAGTRNMSFYEASEYIKVKADWQKKNLMKFKNNIERLILQDKKGISLTTLIENIINTFNLRQYIEDTYEDKEDIEDRINSLEVLKTFIRNNTLESFITYVYSNEKDKKKKEENCVKLMSVHKSKGLEFNNVFIIGIEEGKFPHNKSEIIDEARLFYVAITRAKKNLCMSQIYDDNLFINQYKNN